MKKRILSIIFAFFMIAVCSIAGGVLLTGDEVSKSGDLGKIDTDQSVSMTASGNWDSYYASSFAGGSGSSSNPYLISTAAQLARMSYFVNNNSSYRSLYYSLTTDIDMSAHYWTSIGKQGSPFTGTFTGNDYTISGLTANVFTVTNTYYVQGLFGYTDGATLKSFSISQANLIGAVAAGATVWKGFVSGYSNGSSFTDIRVVDSYMEMSLTSAGYCFIGGIVGAAGTNNTISRCCVVGTDIYGGSENSTISNNSAVGGIAGSLGGAVYDSFFNGHIDVYCCKYGGGIVGWISSSSSTTIASCYFVETSTAYLGFLISGGICGVVENSSSYIKSCFVDAEINNNYTYMNYTPSGTKYLGSIVGRQTAGYIYYSCWYGGKVPNTCYGSKTGGTDTGCKAFTSQSTAKVDVTSTFYTSSSYLYGSNSTYGRTWSSAVWGKMNSNKGTNGYPYLMGSGRSCVAWSSNSAQSTTVSYGVATIQAQSYDTSKYENSSSSLFFIYGQSISVSAVAQTGYKFDHWAFSNSTSAASVSTSASAAVMIKKSQTGQLYAHFIAKDPYTLTYNANGGSVSPSSKIIYYDEAYGTLATPTRTGYSFDGWYTAASGGTQVTSSTVHNTKGNVTIYAHWTIIYYTLTINAGTGIQAVTTNATETLNTVTRATTSASLTYQSAATIKAFAAPGYTFTGWTISSGSPTIRDTGSPNTTLTMPASNVTVTANATANYYLVSYNTQGGSYPSGGSSIQTTAALSNISVTNPYGYYFKLNSAGYYESTNWSVHSSYAMAKVVFTTTASNVTVYFDYINYGEANCDYGVFGNLDVALNFDTSSTNGSTVSNSSAVQTKSYSVSTAGEHFVWIKYRKDGSINYYNDSLQFTMRSTNVSSWRVETPMQFVLGSDGYYTSTNAGIHDSYSIARVNFTTNTANQQVTFNMINYAEANCDFGILSNLDSTLSASSVADSSYAYTLKSNSTGVYSYTYTVATAGSHYIYVKFRKDFSVHNPGDYFKFKITNTTVARYGSTYGTLNSSTKTYYTLNGWYTASSGGSLVSSTTTFSSTANVTLYAQWAPTSISVFVYMYVISADGGTVTQSTVGGSLSIYRYLVSGNSSTGGTVSQTASYTQYALIHQGQEFRITATVNPGYVFAGISTSSSPGDSIKNPTAPPNTTVSYYPTGTAYYYVYFKQVGANQLKYDSVDKYFYFEDGYYPQSEATVSASTLNSSASPTGESFIYNDGIDDVEIPVYSYGSDRYVRVTARGETKWFKFEPIRWRISDYGVANTERNISRYTTLLKFQNYTSYAQNFVAVSDLILGVGAMHNTRNVQEGDSITDMVGFQNIQNTTDGCTILFSYMSTANTIKIQSYATYSQGNTIYETTMPYTAPLRVVSMDELETVGFANKQARASDMVAFILGVDKNNASYWTRDLSNLGSGVSISASGTKTRSWLNELLGVRFAYTFSEGSNASFY